MKDEHIKTHPVQTRINRIAGGKISEGVALKAYEVYSKVFAPQVALITGNCRGGFSTGELIAFLYASSFPEKEWHDRVKEAFAGMENI